MGGGWFGYVLSMGACGVVLALIAGSTAFLYAYARAKGDGPKVRVTSVSGTKD